MASRSGDDRLDRLARSLVSGTLSRRQVVAGVAGAVVSAAAFDPLEALGVTRKCPRGHARCGTHCCPLHAKCVTRRCKCNPGLHLCSGHCRNLLSDPHNCSKCGHVCPKGQVCSHGHCRVTCATGLTNCSNHCVHLTSDVHNCGTCGHACASGQTCVKGVCTTPCRQQGQGCSSTVHCCPGLACAGGHCVVPCHANGGTCASSADCCAGLACNSSHLCQPLPPCLGVACTTSPDNCCAGTFCDLNKGVCSVTDGQPCRSSADCRLGGSTGFSTCKNSVCTPGCRPAGDSCDDGDECCSNNCQGKTLGVTNSGMCCGNVGAACTADGQCCATSICRGGICKACGTGGATCATNADCCAGATCTSGHCTTPCVGNGQDCTVNPNCCSGFICTAAGVCGVP